MAGETSQSSESPSDPKVPVDEDERAAFHSGTVASGHETSEDDIDEILYGARPFGRR